MLPDNQIDFNPQPECARNAPPLKLVFGAECGVIPTPELWRTLLDDSVPDYTFAYVPRIGRRTLRVDAWLVLVLAVNRVPYLRVEFRGGRRTQARYVFIRDIIAHGKQIEDDDWLWWDFDAALLHKFARPIVKGNAA